VCHEAIDQKITKYKEAGHIVPKREIIKNAKQIEGIKESCKINIAVLDYIEEHIGVGTTGEAPYPYNGHVINVPVEIDETTLNKIATIADGNYYRATSNTKLKEVYEKIDKLERTKLQVKEYSRKEEEYAIFAIIALAALMLELLLRNTLLKTIP
jgi:hypothetical protein